MMFLRGDKALISSRIAESLKVSRIVTVVGVDCYDRTCPYCVEFSNGARRWVRKEALRQIEENREWWCDMLKEPRIRVTRDCIDKSTGEVWIKRGSTGTLQKIFNNDGNFLYEVLLDDGRRIAFRRESIAPDKKGYIC